VEEETREQWKRRRHLTAITVQYFTTQYRHKLSFYTAAGDTTYGRTDACLIIINIIANVVIIISTMVSKQMYLMQSVNCIKYIDVFHHNGFSNL